MTNDNLCTLVNGYEVVRLNPSMLSQIEQLEKQCFSIPWSSEVLSADMLRHDSFSTSFSMGVRDGDTLLAYVYATIVVDELHVLRMGVDINRRRRGLGKLLLENLLLEAKRKGVRYALLECRKSNDAAEKLYRSLGFSLVGVRRNYYADNHEDALLFTCNL